MFIGRYGIFVLEIREMFIYVRIWWNKWFDYFIRWCFFIELWNRNCWNSWLFCDWWGIGYCNSWWYKIECLCVWKSGWNKWLK